MSNIPTLHLVTSDSPESQGGNDSKKQDISSDDEGTNVYETIKALHKTIELLIRSDRGSLDKETKEMLTRLEKENSELKNKVVSLLTQCDVLQNIEKEHKKTIELLQGALEKQVKDNSSLLEENEALLLNYGVVDVRRDGTIIDMSELMERISGYSLDEIRGKNMSVMSSGTHDREFWDLVFETIHAGLQWRGDIRNLKKDGTPQWLDTIIFPKTDHNGRFTFFRVARRDITDIIEKDKKINAFTSNEIDPITGLPTTRKMYKDYAKKSPKRLSILHINDIEHINIVYGPLLGDKILQKIAKLLKNYTNEHPELGIGIYRLGGGDFAIVYNNDIKNEFAQEQYERLQKVKLYKFGSTHPDPEFTFTPTFSFGIATDEPDIYRSLQNAELALKVTKGQSNGVTIYNKSLDIELPSEKVIQLTKNIAYAFDNDGFEIHFQPIVKLNQYGKIGKIFSRIKKRWFPKKEAESLKYEILVRMKDMNDSTKLISPVEFLERIQKEGKYKQLTNRVIQLACEFMLKNSGHYSINLTADDLNHVGRAAEILKIIKSCGINPSRFTWEILENIEFLTPEAFDNIKYLHEQRCKFSIDDYGSGFSSIGRLDTIHAYMLKIDKSLIRGIDTNTDNAYKVKKAIKAAHGGNVKVVAEGVETEAEKQMVIDLGADYIQGFIDDGKPKDHI